MKQNITNIIIFAAIIVVVHVIYQIVIWPDAEQVLAAAQQNGTVAPRHWAILLKDMEQQICFMLLFIGLYYAMIVSRAMNADEVLFHEDFLDGIGPKRADLIDALKEFDASEKFKQTPLLRTIRAALRRLIITDNVQNASDAIDQTIEAISAKNDNELAVLKYICWAVPSIGFVGTVRGIGAAMAQADSAVAGDIGPMTESLGIAFNSTLVALVISIFLMMVLFYLQSKQDSHIERIQVFCEEKFIERVSNSPQHSNADDVVLTTEASEA
ncbi:MAG: MotA/TolQ/ExbB proton channel family protein [Arenicella sp.]|nr:MotA/TolQ/ExbB proton channel family protein [Arenicella sp.]